MIMEHNTRRRLWSDDGAQRDLEDTCFLHDLIKGYADLFAAAKGPSTLIAAQNCTETETDCRIKFTRNQNSADQFKVVANC
jgi:hypothetical protein